MSTFLLDANVAIALVVRDHEQHARARTWFARSAPFAVCPIVEGALARYLLRVGESGATVSGVLQGLRRHPAVTFWPDDLSYAGVPLADLRGHRQVTDAYLVALAVARAGLLATFDARLALLRPSGTLLVP